MQQTRAVVASVKSALKLLHGANYQQSVLFVNLARVLERLFPVVIVVNA